MTPADTSRRPAHNAHAWEWVRYLKPFLADADAFNEELRQMPGLAANATVYLGLCEGMTFGTDQDRATRVRVVIETLGARI